MKPPLSKVVVRRGIFAPSGGQITASNPDAPPIDTGAIHRGAFAGPHHEAYVAAFRAKMDGERCQCAATDCLDYGEQVHHEFRGVHKDDRSIVWLSLRCHDLRHREVGIGMTSRASADHLKGQALANFLAYLDSFA